MSFKKQLREQSEKVAAIKRNKRKLRRKENVQLSEINNNYNGLIDAFQKMLFTTDWDNPNTPDIPIYRQFNDAWLMFCNNWNKSKKNILKANENAFYEWACDNTALNPDSKPNTLNGIQKPIL